MTTDSTKLRQDVLIVLGAFLAALVLWQFRSFSPIVYPLRLFVTFIHELGHGLAAVATGGEFIRFEVQSNGAGLAYSRGGLRPIVISAGYMGTALFGAGLLLLGNRMKQPRYLSAGLGTAFSGLTLVYSGLGISNINIIEGGLTLLLLVGGAFLLMTQRERIWGSGVIALGVISMMIFAAGSNLLTLLVGTLGGVLLVLLGVYGSRDVNLYVLNFLAFSVGLNAITDAWLLFQVVSFSNSYRNDAVTMAEETALMPEFWAVMWIIFALVLLGAVSWLLFLRPMRVKEHTEND